MSTPPRPVFSWPTASLGSLIALLVLIVAVISLLVTVNVQNLPVWLIIALAVAVLLR